MEARAREEEEREKKVLSATADAAVRSLEADLAFLEEHPEIWERLRRTVREKRRIDHIPASFRAVMGTIALTGAAGAFWGLYSLFSGRDYGLWGILFGAAFLFYAASSRILPLGADRPSAAGAAWTEAVRSARESLSSNEDFFLPAQYADPVVIRRMLRVLKSGRAGSREEALEAVKEDLRALNSSVSVSKEEYDEVAAVKPLFMECGYMDELSW
jgi:hypothetical protein